MMFVHGKMACLEEVNNQQHVAILQLIKLLNELRQQNVDTEMATGNEMCAQL
tara:strand:- start:35385 stop:35540 length:156 start_codon:yes stop_codon:yes gene_type:complete